MTHTTEPKEYCDYCNNTGVVGHPPDDYFNCPKCTTEPTVEQIYERLNLIMALAEPYMNRDGAGLDEDWQEFIAVVQSTAIEIEDHVSDQVAKARIEETSLWYNEWGNGTDEIGDGSWEDYYAHRIQTLNGVKSK